MGHAEGGMTAKYGTKDTPKPINIKMLNDAIHSLDWPMLTEIQPNQV